MQTSLPEQTEPRKMTQQTDRIEASSPPDDEAPREAEPAYLVIPRSDEWIPMTAAEDGDRDPETLRELTKRIL
ncbi:unnamed protein product [Boreogadus saida]